MGFKEFIIGFNKVFIRFLMARFSAQADPDPTRSGGRGGVTLSCAIVLPGRKSVFRAGFRPDSIHRPFGRPKVRGRADFEALRLESGQKLFPEARFPAGKHYCET